MYEVLLLKHFSSVVMEVDQELPLFCVENSLFFHVWIFDEKDIGSYFHICGFTVI